MAVTLNISNRLEDLAASLAEVLRGSPLPPLAVETVVVQSRGMARWLAMRQAEELGAWANVRCPFPNSFVQEMVGKILPDESRPLFSREETAWRIMKILPGLLSTPAFATLFNYLAGHDDLKRFQLAQRIADLFDQYDIYRPEMLLDWETGGGEGWQPELFRALMAPAGDGAKPGSRAALLRECLRRLADPTFAADGLPPRISIFGVTSLPPFYLRFFAGLGLHLPIHIFLMNPCREYWADIVTDRQAERLAERLGATPEELYLDSGNSLLASMGTLGRDFFALLAEFDFETREHFSAVSSAEFAGATLLTHIQNDILDLRQTSFEPAAGQLFPPSITVHSCHSPMREVEVLRDQILARLSRDHTLEPRDILVMTPDIELYGPLIQAVFDKGHAGEAHVPFSIADRTIRSEGRLVEALLKIMDLAGGRFAVTQVVEVLELAQVRQRFGLADSEFTLIRQWLKTTGVRWGIDAGSRERLGLPAFSENTWQAGLDRLLLGYAMADTNGQPFADIIPYDAMEGDEARLLGRFADCLETVFSQVDLLSGRHTLENWGVILGSVLDSSCHLDDDSAQEAQFLRSVLAEFTILQHKSGFLEQVELPVVRTYLERALERESFTSGFLSGGMTFCAMLPMRAIPFKLICLLGMDDTFPRTHQPPSFDLMAASPRPGDRSRRHDDRYLFLEALISSRQELYVSYVGQSIKDGSRREPSVLVSELLDYLDKGSVDNGYQARQALVVEHRLQPFSPLYFSGRPDLISYSEENFQAAAVAGQGLAPEFFGKGSLSEPSDDFKVLTLDTLRDFFVHPARHLCRKRLGLLFDRQNDTLDDAEPFEVEGLEKYFFAQELFDSLRLGHSSAEIYETARLKGLLPHGEPGRAEFSLLVDEARLLEQRVAPYLDADPLPDLEIDLVIDGFTLTGRLPGIRQAGLTRFRCAKVKAGDQLRAWITHLLLNAAAPVDYPRRSILIGSDKVYCMEPLEEAGSMLRQLLACYWRGLSRALPFFPESSLVFAQSLAKEGRQAALDRARQKWQGSEFAPGEADDPYFRLCFSGNDPLNEEFEHAAVDIFMPLFTHRESV